MDLWKKFCYFSKLSYLLEVRQVASSFPVGYSQSSCWTRVETVVDVGALFCGDCSYLGAICLLRQRLARYKQRQDQKAKVKTKRKTRHRENFNSDRMFGFLFHADRWLIKDQVKHVLREVI